jgi:hypothetical protein
VAVAGRLRDIGHNLLQSSFQTGCNSSPIYIQVFFLIAVFEDALLRNIIITLRIHYAIIIVSINNNNNNNTNVIIHNYRWHENLISLFKTPTGGRSNSFDIYRQMEHGPSKGFARPGLQQSSPSAFSICIEFFQVSHYVVFPHFSPCKQVGRRGEDGGVRIKNATIQLPIYHYDLSLWDTFIWTYRKGQHKRVLNLLKTATEITNSILREPGISKLLNPQPANRPEANPFPSTFHVTAI